MAPEACYTPNEIKKEKKLGLKRSTLLRCSEKNWGIGDFSDLALLIEKAAGVGADFIGLILFMRFTLQTQRVLALWAKLTSLA